MDDAPGVVIDIFRGRESPEGAHDLAPEDVEPPPRTHKLLVGSRSVRTHVCKETATDRLGGWFHEIPYKDLLYNDLVPA